MPIGFSYRDSSNAVGVFEKYFFTKNLQGDIIEIYKEDGTKVASYNYDAWGNHSVLDANGDPVDKEVTNFIGNINPFRYRGYYFDSETNFYYLNSRYYSPETKRFLNADNLGYLGANGDLQSFNLYAYCSNNPVMYVDAYGNKWYDAFENLLVTLFESIEAHAGLGFGLGAKVSGILKAELSRDTGVVIDDGKFDAANFVSAKLTVVNDGSDITSLGYEAQTNHGHYKADNYIELWKEELNCEECRVKDKTFFMFTIKENGDIVIGVSVSAHIIIGGRAGIGINLSDIKRNFMEDWNS